MDVNQAEDIICNHVYNKRKAEEEKREREEKELEKLMNEIRELEPRIKNIITIGNMCIDNGINLNRVGTYRNCLYEEDAYETDAIHHQLGFYPNHYKAHPFYKCSHYDYIGYRMGGACGNKDFITDGDIIANIPHKSKNVMEKTKPSIRICKKFLKDFENFEKVFYEFINNLK